jgi:hypothetical protein
MEDNILFIISYDVIIIKLHVVVDDVAYVLSGCRYNSSKL